MQEIVQKIHKEELGFTWQLLTLTTGFHQIKVKFTLMLEKEQFTCNQCVAMKELSPPKKFIHYMISGMYALQTVIIPTKKVIERQIK